MSVSILYVITTLVGKLYLPSYNITSHILYNEQLATCLFKHHGWYDLNIYGNQTKFVPVKLSFTGTNFELEKGFSEKLEELGKILMALACCM